MKGFYIAYSLFCYLSVLIERIKPMTISLCIYSYISEAIQQCSNESRRIVGCADNNTAVFSPQGERPGQYDTYTHTPLLQISAAMAAGDFVLML